MAAHASSAALLARSGLTDIHPVSGFREYWSAPNSGFALEHFTRFLLRLKLITFIRDPDPFSR
jgi:hypothetical protein